jgi:hypothetical protein
MLFTSGKDYSRKSNWLCVQTMDDGILDEGDLGYCTIHNQDRNRLDSDEGTEDSTSRSGQGGTRLGKYGKRKAGNTSAGKICEAGSSF